MVPSSTVCFPGLIYLIEFLEVHVEHFHTSLHLKNIIFILRQRNDDNDNIFI